MRNPARPSRRLSALSRGQALFSILDLNLGDENAFPIADALQTSGGPFLFTTGIDELPG